MGEGGDEHLTHPSFAPIMCKQEAVGVKLLSLFGSVYVSADGGGAMSS